MINGNYDFFDQAGSGKYPTFPPAFEKTPVQAPGGKDEMLAL
jgi:hypothetical protein